MYLRDFTEYDVSSNNKTSYKFVELEHVCIKNRIQIWRCDIESWAGDEWHRTL